MSFDLFGVVKTQNSVNVAMFYLWLIEVILRWLVTWQWASTQLLLTTWGFSACFQAETTHTEPQRGPTEENANIWAFHQMGILSST